MLIRGHRQYLYVVSCVSASGLSNAGNVSASGPVPPATYLGVLGFFKFDNLLVVVDISIIVVPFLLEKISLPWSLSELIRTKYT